MAILVAMFGALSSANSFGLLPISLLLLSVVVWLLGKRRAVHRHQTFPPGPSPLPLIGNLAQIDLVNPHRTFVAWKRRYGPIYTVWLPKPHVVIAGEKELDEYFLSPAYADKFADRPTHSFLYGIFNKHQRDGDGIILARREVAQKNRRFALGAFRQLGISGTRGEALIRLQVDSLVRRLAEKALHEPLLDDLHSQFAFCIGNIIHHLVTGRHYGYNDSEFLQSKKLIDCVVEEVSGPQLLLVDTYPRLRFVLPAYWRYRRAGFALQRLFLREIDAHVERLQLQLQLHQRRCQDGTERRHQQTADGEHVDQGDGLTTAMSEEITTATTSRRTEEETQLLEPSLIPDNFIDAFLLASSAEEEGHVQQQQQNWHQPAFKLSLALSAGDLWAGGLETMVATMCWAVLYLLNYPDVQKKLHNELSERLGGRAFRMADRMELPYLRAFIDELQRIINVLPWNLPHSVSEEVVLCGRWRVPADTRVMPQVGAVHLDPELFPDPEQFRPDRFLDSHGNYIAPVWLKPFGVGKRMCLGESLAKMEMFIILAALVQNFEFTTLYPNEAPSLRRNNGLANIPDQFECVIRLRPSEPILCKPNDA